MRDNVDSLAPVESTPRIEPDPARPGRDEHRPSGPGGHCPPPFPPPPPGLVALNPPPSSAPTAAAAPPADEAPAPPASAASPMPSASPALPAEDHAVTAETGTMSAEAAAAAAETEPAAPASPVALSGQVLRAEPAHASAREHPSWLGEPTGRFDLDLPEPGGLSPRFATAVRHPDPDQVFDQYALADDFDEHAFHDPAAAGGMVDPASIVAAAALPAGGAVAAAALSGPALPGQPGGGPAHPVRPEFVAAPQPPVSAPTEPFTMPVQEVPREPWFDPRLHGGRVRTEPRPAGKPRRPPRAPRRARVAMPLLVLFALLAAFFSWVSAEPLWLALGHGRTGTLTVTSCAGSGLLQRCVGEFATPARDFTAVSVDVFGPPGQAEGLSAPARMVGENSHRAYVSNGTGGLHLRWIVGLSLVLLCSVGIVFATGALRLPERRHRLAAVGLAFAGPFLITIGFLSATF